MMHVNNNSLCFYEKKPVVYLKQRNSFEELLDVIVAYSVYLYISFVVFGFFTCILCNPFWQYN